MAIQIIDGFQVNTALPIDNRIVASGSATRNAISYKYHGLRVFDISDNIPYVWNGSSWLSENASGVITSNSLPNYIPKFTTTPNVIGNSIIYQSGSNNIAIGTTTPTAVPGETTTFHVLGGIRANKFAGDGSLIIGLDGSNIANGTVTTNKLINGSTGQIIVAGVTTPSWTNQSQLSVGTSSFALTASNTINVGITNNTSNTTNYLPFVSATGSTNLKVNTNGLSYNPSTNITNTNGGDIWISSTPSNVFSLTSAAAYVIRGTRTHRAFGVGSATINPIIATINNIPNYSTITVDVTFTSKGVEIDSSLNIVGSDHLVNKFISSFRVGNSGVISQFGLTASVLAQGYSGSSILINAGTIDITTANQIKFKQSVTGPGGGNIGDINLMVDYKISIS